MLYNLFVFAEFWESILCICSKWMVAIPYWRIIKILSIYMKTETDS